MRQPNGYNYASSLPVHWGRVESARQELSSVQKRLFRALDLDADEELVEKLRSRVAAAELVFDHQQVIAELIDNGQGELVAQMAA